MDYDWTEFSITFFYDAPVDVVFRKWATPSGLESFYIARCKTASSSEELIAAGDSYHFYYVHDFDHAGVFRRVEPNNRVAFSFGEMEVAVSFVEVEGATRVVLRQTGIDDQVMSHMNCRSCWLYFMTNLKSVLEHGIDLRDHAHPERASSMEVGFRSELTGDV